MLAVIDLGSNAIRMGIYSKENNKIKELSGHRIQVRLAEGLNTDDLLKEDPQNRTIDALKKFRAILDKKNITNIHFVSTEVLRRAKNADTFIKRVKDELNLEITILDGKQEATFGAIAVRSSVPVDNFYVLDTGGGSFELSKIENAKVVDSVCLPYGCVVLTEQFDPDNGGFIFMDSFLKNVFDGISFIDKPYPIVTLGGSVKELAKCLLTDNDIDGKSVSENQVFEIFEEILNTPVSDRVQKFKMDGKRVDLITAGLCPLTNLLKKTGSGKIYFSLRSVRDGVAAHILKNE